MFRHSAHSIHCALYRIPVKAAALWVCACKFRTKKKYEKKYSQAYLRPHTNTSMSTPPPPHAQELERKTLA